MGRGTSPSAATAWSMVAPPRARFHILSRPPPARAGIPLRGAHMGGAVAVILIKERHMVEALQRAGATSPATARTLDNLGAVGIDADGIAWRRLRDRAVVREAAPGAFYVDIEVWQALRRQRRRLILVMLVLILIAAIFGISTVATQR
ncbi:MAG: hypothetical protein ABI625_05575 [bacterium]